MADNVYNVCSEPSDVEQCSNNDFCLNYYLHMMLTHCTKLKDSLQMMNHNNDELQVKLNNVEMENDKMRAQIIVMTEANDSLRKKKFYRKQHEVKEPSVPRPLGTSTPAVRKIKDEKSNNLLPLVASTPQKNNNSSVMSSGKENSTKKQSKMLSFVQINTIKELNKTPDADVCKPSNTNKSIDFGAAFSDLSLKNEETVELKKEPKVNENSSSVFPKGRNRLTLKRKLHSSLEKSNLKSPVDKIDLTSFDETIAHLVMNDEAVGGCVENIERDSITQDGQNNSFLSTIAKCSSDSRIEKTTSSPKSQDIEIPKDGIGKKKTLPQTPDGFWNPFFSQTQQ